jgi:hypothetical protein
MPQYRKLVAITALALICASTILGCNAYTPAKGGQIITISSSDAVSPSSTATVNATSTTNSDAMPSPTLEPTVTTSVIEITAITAIVTFTVASLVMILVKRHDKPMEK